MQLCSMRWAGLLGRNQDLEALSLSGFPHRRERSKVPYIVRQCVEEIERRGMEEVGIYRVSGVATDIQALKAAFDVSECQHRPCQRLYAVPFLALCSSCFFSFANRNLRTHCWCCI